VRLLAPLIAVRVARAAGITAFVLAATAPLAAQNGAADARLGARLDSVLAQTVRAGPAPGVTILVARGPHTRYAKGAGLANVENGVSAAPATVYNIASITKQFAAALVRQLALERRLSLDDDVTRFLPDQPTPAGRVTLRHLLTHTSGLTGAVPDSLRPRNFVRVDLAPGERVALGRHARPAFAPGAAFRYAPYNYMLLAAVVERVTGQRFDDVLAERIAGPLGLRSLVRCDPAALIPRRASEYVLDRARRLAPAPYASPTQASGNAGLCAAAPDLAAWTWALASGRVLPPAAYRQMVTPGTLADGTALDYGLGLQVGALGTHPKVYHSGGAAASCRCCPTTRRTRSRSSCSRTSRPTTTTSSSSSSASRGRRSGCPSRPTCRSTRRARDVSPVRTAAAAWKRG
jgi:D-alanyl-D-alanine carboxypeptidase